MAAVFTVIFPGNIPLLKEFVSSLNNQTSREFEVIIANDGIQDPERYFVDLVAPCRIINVSGTPAEIRQWGINFLAHDEYPYVVFADSDDMLGPNRIEHSIQMLHSHKAVCNDLDLMSYDGSIFYADFWGGRLQEGIIVDQQFLADKNVAGLGNVAIRRELLKPLSCPSDLLAVDWFLFYQLLEGNSAVFTKHCKTRYRQHPGNTIGLEKVDAERLMKIISTKKKHYEGLLKQGYALQDHLDRTLSLEYKLKHSDTLNRAILLLNRKSINYFWWEETNYLA